MGIAVGGGATRATEDLPNLFRIDDYGAYPGTDAGAMASVTAAWEAIRARIRALPLNTPTEVYFPPGVWRVDGPLWVDWDNTTIHGAARDTTSLSVWNSMGSSAMIVGLDRTPLGQSFPSDRRPWHWEVGPLDGTTGGYAYRLGGGYHLAAAGTIADVGLAQWAGYQDASGVIRAAPRQLTIEVAFMYHGLIPEGVQLCGMLERYFADPFERWVRGAVRPWSLWFSEPSRWGQGEPSTPLLTFTIATTDGPEPAHEKSYLPNFSDGRQWEINLGSIPADMLIRLVVQVDLATASVTAFVNNVQVTATPIYKADPGTGWTSSANLHFVRNDCWPFKIGADGRWPTSRGSEGVHGEFTVYGMAVATALRYYNDGVGQPIRRIDGGTSPPDDRWRYTDDQSSLTSPALWFLSGEFANDCDGRVARLVHGRLSYSQGMRCTALLCDSSSNRWQNTNYVTHVNVIIRDMTIASGLADYVDIFGAPLIVRGLLNLHLERVGLFGGWHGLQVLFSDSMYPVYMDDVRAAGAGAAILLVRTTASIRWLDVGLPGLYGVLLFGGDTTIDGLRCAGWNGRFGHALVKRYPQEWGSMLTLRDLWDDTESGFTPCEGLIVAERGDYATPCSLTVQNISMSRVGQGAPTIALRGRSASSLDTIARCDIRSISSYEVALGGLVAVDSPDWHGVVSEPSVPLDSEDDFGRLIVYTDRFSTGITQARVVLG